MFGGLALLDISIWLWLVTVGGLVAVIGFDLFLVLRRPHVPSLSEAAAWVLGYVALAAVFGLVIFFFAGAQAGGQFFAGYLTEYSLSADNLFVFLLIITRFQVPAVYQQRVVLTGILISLALRCGFIVAGVAVIHAFNWVFYIFGVVLIYTAITLLRGDDDEEQDIENSAIIRGLQRVLPTTNTYDGARLTTRVDGRRMITPMLMVIAAIGIANVVFALDSIPAIFGLTQDMYIVFAATAFALMGLRQLYFVINGLLERLVYLNIGLAFILGFIGVKLVMDALHGSGVNAVGPVPVPRIGIALSLGVIVGTLVITAVASLLKTRHDRKHAPAEMSATGDGASSSSSPDS